MNTQGRKHALSFMPKEFTFEEFDEFCRTHPNICKNPKRQIGRYKHAKLIEQRGDKYVILDEVERVMNKA